MSIEATKNFPILLWMVEAKSTKTKVLGITTDKLHPYMHFIETLLIT